MKKLEQKFKNIAAETRLTSDEKGAMRAYLSEYRAMKPLLHVTDMQELRHEGQARPSPLSGLFLKPMPIILAVALLFAGSTGVSLAAQHALPGDFLYPVKVSVDEKVEGAFAVSTGAKASFDTTLADRRLSEAETLAAKGALTASAAGTLQASFTENTENASAHIVALESENSGDAAVAETKLAAVLSTHADILDRVQVSSGNAGAKTALASALDSEVKAHGTLSAQADENASASVAAAPRSAETLSASASGRVSASPSVSTAAKVSGTIGLSQAVTLKNAAHVSFERASTTLDSLSGKISAETYADAQASLKASADLIAEGDALIAADIADSLSAAYGKYRMALFATEQLKLRLQSNASIRIPVSVTPVSFTTSRVTSKPSAPSGTSVRASVSPSVIMKVTPTAHVQVQASGSSSETVSGSAGVSGSAQDSGSAPAPASGSGNTSVSGGATVNAGVSGAANASVSGGDSGSVNLSF